MIQHISTWHTASAEFVEQLSGRAGFGLSALFCQPGALKLQQQPEELKEEDVYLA